MADDSTEVRRQKIREEFMGRWKNFGNLTEAEIQKLTHFETVQGPETVIDQLDRYYLLLKVEKPQAAERLRVALEAIEKTELDEGKIVQICHTLYEYWSGFVIHFNGQAYTTTSRPEGLASMKCV